MGLYQNLTSAIEKNNEQLALLGKRLDKLSNKVIGGEASKEWIENEQRLIYNKIEDITQRNEKLGDKILKEQSNADKLKQQVELLRKENDTIVSNNYLLEYKKKDLLVLADNLEEAYDEISEKNKEILAKSEQLQIANDEITAKSVELQKQKEEIEEQAAELENQKGAMLDQADYLHDANESITAMHQEVQQQKDEILEKNEELVILNNEKNSLIGIVAHDLKSPLNQIAGLVSLIKLTSDNMDEESLKYISTIGDSAGRLNAMIAKILDIEAIESKASNLNFEPVDLTDLIAELTANYNMTASEKNIALNIHVDKKKQIAIVDRSFALQVFENLLSNAIKFSPKDKKIEVFLTKGKDTIRFEVKDQGPGISQTDQSKLFGKYQKLSAKPTGNETSTGLGLSIVKKYVEAMDGKIWCESESGKGASFIVEFKTAK